MQAGIDIVHIPYKGAGPALMDLMGGRVEAMFSHRAIGARRRLRGGKVRALGVTSTTARSRSAGRADHRRVGHAGLRGHLVAGPVRSRRQCRKPALARLRAALAAALALPDTRKRLADSGFQAHPAHGVHLERRSSPSW